VICVALALAISSYVPPLDQVVVYEANLRAHTPDYGFNSVTRRLKAIRRLGVNVLWLMPIQPVGKVRSAGGLGSPYAPASYDTVNPEFGTEADFRELVRSAHNLKMAVILDWVANHTAWDHPWIKQHPDWYTRNARGEIQIPAGTNWQDVADLNFGNQSMRNALTESMQGWVDRFGIDGFRCDTADNVPFDYWKPTIEGLRSKTPRRLLMLAEGFRSDHYEAGFDLTFGWPTFDRLVSIYKGAKATEFARAVQMESNGLPLGARRLRFTTNHDKAAWDGSARDFFATTQGSQAAFAVTVLYGGVPLIYTGQEVDWPARVPIFDRIAIDWSAEEERGRWISALLKARQQYPSLRSNQVQDISSDNVIAFTKFSGNEDALVLANVRNRPVDYSLPSSLRGSWTSAPGGKGMVLGSNQSLNAYEYRIYIRKSQR
jgi:glycosidase